MSPIGPVSRRRFLSTSSSTVAVGATLSAASYARAADGNQRLRIGFIGTGRRGFGSHVKSLVKLRQAGQPIDLVGVCDVYSVHRDQAVDYIQRETGTQPKTFADYRDMLEGETVDALCIATPDHWHATQMIDALQAGKHVYGEKPMTHTLDEAHQVVKAWRESGKVMQVGVQSTSMPIWNEVREQINEGRLGKVVQFHTQASRNSLGGMSRHNVITKEMTPQTIDWHRWLGVEQGLTPALPFDRSTYGQWRCYWPFGYGMYSDLFVHRVTTMLKATGLRFPGRVVGGGGIFLEFDNRDVPDVATVVADFHEGVQGLISSTMISEEIALNHAILGHHGSILFDNEVYGAKQAYTFLPERPQVTLNSKLTKEETISQRVKDQDAAHFTNFLEAVAQEDPHLVNNPPELGAAAIAVVNLAVRSYREGRVFQLEPQTGKVVDGDASWADHWETKSEQKSEPPHVSGWNAGDKGSKLQPPAYQRLAGPWIDGKDPAEA